MKPNSGVNKKQGARWGTKVVNGSLYEKRDGVWMVAVEGCSSRKNSWITISQINDEFPEFINKIADILYFNYREETKEYARGVLGWLDMWKFISWKQFDSIMRICSDYEHYKRSWRNNIQVVQTDELISVRSGNVSYTYRGKDDGIWNERKVDRMHEKLFGFGPLFEEEVEYGAVRKYRNDGSRYFAFPTGEEKLSDYLHLGISFKGLYI